MHSNMHNHIIRTESASRGGAQSHIEFVWLLHISSCPFLTRCMWVSAPSRRRRAAGVITLVDYYVITFILIAMIIIILVEFDEDTVGRSL